MIETKNGEIPIKRKFQISEDTKKRIKKKSKYL